MKATFEYYTKRGVRFIFSWDDVTGHHVGIFIPTNEGPVDKEFIGENYTQALAIAFSYIKNAKLL